VVLVLFGVTWPVLQLLADNAEFFLARDSSRTEMILLALALVVGLPAAVGALAAIPGRFGEILGSALIAVSGVVLAHVILGRLPLAWGLTLLLAVAGGLMIWWLVHRWAVARQVARFLLPAPLVLLAFLAWATPAGALVLERGALVGSPVMAANPSPIVMVVLDEFPVASLIDSAGDLRADRYPNFARLAADGTWFRNAVTVEQQTEHSLPAILTGVIPDQSTAPFAGHHPDNLFTALQGSYALEVDEAITGMCPARLCQEKASTAPPLVTDLTVVAGHVLLPEPAAASLPPIDQTWGGFGADPGDFDAVAEFQASLATDRRQAVNRLVDAIEDYDDARPPLFFAHLLLPHHPWQYLPDGRRYPLVVQRNPASLGGGWIDDDFLVGQGMQRHLLQVGYVDHALGRIIDALEAKGLYEGAVVVVVADHGIAIKPGVRHQRTITADTIGDIAAVPLFIKAPGVEEGLVDDRRALTIDIVPTIATLIAAPLGWETDGVSLVGPTPSRSETTTVGPRGAVTYGTAGTEKLDVARRIEEWFPAGDPWALQPADTPDLRGTEIDVDALRPSAMRVRLRNTESYSDVDTHGDVIPVRVAGVIEGAQDDVVLAVMVNGTVAAVTRSYHHEDEMAFLAMIEPKFFVEGENRIQVAEITDGPTLLRIRQA
jgi:hypothetical protein